MNTITAAAQTLRVTEQKSGRLKRAILQCAPVIGGIAIMYVILISGDAFFARADPVARLFDEGMTLSQSSRILMGQVPYADFWLIYGPGQYYVLAALFHFFGTTIGVERAWDFVVRAGIAVCIYVYCRPFLGHGRSLAAFGVAVLLLSTANFYGYVMFPTLCFALVAACSLQRALITGLCRFWLLAGLAVGAVATFRHDIGFMLSCTTCALILARRYTFPLLPGKSQPDSLPTISYFFTGLAVAGLQPYVYIIMTAGFSTFIYTFITYPLVIFRGAHSIPLPNPLELLSAALRGETSTVSMLYQLMFHIIPLLAPIVTYLGVAALLCHQHFVLKRSIFADKHVHLWPILLLGLILLNQALNRADRIHAVPTTLVAIIVAAWVLWTLTKERYRKSLMITASALMLAYPSFILEPLNKIRQFPLSIDHAQCVDSTIDRRRSCTYLDSDHLEALRFVDRHADTTEYVYVGISRHDRLFAHDALSYFLLGRPNPTRYDDLLSGRVRTLEVQQEISQQLDQHRVNYLLLFGGFADILEPNGSSESSGVRWLDDFIQREYHEVLRSGRYSVWQRT